MLAKILRAFHFWFILIYSAIKFYYTVCVYVCVYTHTYTHTHIYGFLGGSDNKEAACNAGDPGSIPGWGCVPRKKNGTHSNILAGKIPWIEEPGGLQSHGVTESDMTE